MRIFCVLRSILKKHDFEEKIVSKKHDFECKFFSEKHDFERKIVVKSVILK